MHCDVSTRNRYAIATHSLSQTDFLERAALAYLEILEINSPFQVDKDEEN